MSRVTKRFYPRIDENSFLGVWIKYLADLETALPFDFWSGIWLLGNVVGRNTVIARPQAPVWLNPYIILVSDSGIGHKSTVIDKAEIALRNVNKRIVENGGEVPVLLSGKGSTEKIEDILYTSTNAQITLVASELARMFGKEGYKMGLPILLTDLYDCREEQTIFGTKGSGSYTIKNIYCSLIAGSTPVWLSRSVSPDVLEGGFASRTLFIYAQHNKQLVAWPPERDETQWKMRLENALYEVWQQARTKPQILMSDGGRQEYSAWYTNRTGTTGVYDQYFHSREPDHVLRLAALLCINDRRWEIQRHDVTNAIGIIESEKAVTRSILVPSTKKEDRLTTGIEKIRHILQSISPSSIHRAELYAKIKHYMTPKMFNTTMEVLHEVGCAEAYKSTYGKSLIYKATRLTVSPNLLPTIHREVAERLSQHAPRSGS
jgi:hypothetical protein